MSEKKQLKFNDIAPEAKLLGIDGKTVKLSSLWKDSVLVLAFTRHFGCPQCKEMLDQLFEAQPSMKKKGLRLVIVTHSSADGAKQFCEQRAPGAICLADSDRSAYRAYGLYPGNIWQTWISPRIWISNRKLAQTKGYKAGLPSAGQDMNQMSGTFIIGMDGRIRLPYYYDDIADHPPVDLILHGVMGVDWKRPFDNEPVV